MITSQTNDYRSFICFFFFSSRRRHTRCGRDWSSDVCSSDLSHVQQASNGDATSRTYTAFSAAFNSTTTSGNAILVGVTYGNLNPTITVTDSQGNTYAQAIKTYDSSHNQGCAVFYALNITGGASHMVTG